MKKALCLAIAALAIVLTTRRAEPCTIFTAHDDAGNVLVGNNEDGYLDAFGSKDTYIWFVPAQDGLHGYAAWGYENRWPQGGMNDQGLFMDTNATAPHDLGPNPAGLLTNADALGMCTTIEDFAALGPQGIGGYTWVTLVADKSGASMIFDGLDPVRPTTNWQVSTNFLQNHPEIAGGYPCWRYLAASSMMKNGLVVSVDYFKKIAERTRQGTVNGASFLTRYTTIGDLKAGKIYLYWNLDYSRVRVFDLAQELAQGAHEYKMCDLFPKDSPDAGQ